ncbi:MAG: excinuclease ABC subunit UvrC [Nanoarchaeota archaeon]|nr:excinuclease ABC subunit UvrC [Nanoarchaeota archaeon]
MRNSEAVIIYVGKAKNIRKRVASYTPSRPHDMKTSQLIQEAESIEYIITDNEVEALILEAKLIWEHKPKYNIDLKDSSGYPHIRITLEEEFPRIFITREKKSKVSLYLGPYTDVKSARRAVKLAIEIFGIRICRALPKYRCLKHDTKLSSRSAALHSKLSNPMQIMNGSKSSRFARSFSCFTGKCSEPCIENITKEDYRKNVEKAVSFLRGNVDDVILDLREKMRGASSAQNYEAAKIYRDEIASVEILSVRQKIDREREYNEDVINYVRADGIYFVQVFNIRRGILLGRTKHEAKSQDEPRKFLADFLKLHYYSAPMPEKIILPEEPKDIRVLADYFGTISGKMVELSVPKAGTKKKILEMLLKNITHDIGAKCAAELIELKDALGLSSVPIVIEFFDVSNISGKWLVGAMVQFRNAEPDKSNYRRFRILGVPGQDDFASMQEIVWRRYSRLVRENKPLPNLVVVDGGAPQLSAAISAMADVGVDIPLAALAKREEEIYLPGRAKPLILERRSAALRLMQRMRDEAHRFAISYHKLLRRKNIK